MPAEPAHRLQLTLKRPLLSWMAKPTVVVAGRGQPAQWGVGTWQLPDETERVGASGVLEVFIFNRLWRYGAAAHIFAETPAAALVYTPPLLPFLPGRLREEKQR
ncbi:hypothetical protein [Microterricola viridarii]|uniref:Uncharacterized protein n=1 Tax=Microterricola viridarii TaxID=412690 RepID=A0A120I179_9MICO|nr:hypothetical protein [Microterricola viridarii]AMB59238.1 hypothetical protein AWU67_10600 [Microterricola viridarii]